jgi:epoxyqueuosine reductase
MDDEAFRERFRNSPIKRTKRVGLQRNVCVALGNIGDVRALPALEKSLVYDDPVIRLHAAWAMGRLGGDDARQYLETALAQENDPEVKEEIKLSIADMAEQVR